MTFVEGLLRARYLTLCKLSTSSFSREIIGIYQYFAGEGGSARHGADPDPVCRGPAAKAGGGLVKTQHACMAMMEINQCMFPGGVR